MEVRKDDIFRKWSLFHSIFTVGVWVFYVFLLAMDLTFTGVPLKFDVRLSKIEFLVISSDSLFVILHFNVRGTLI